MATTNLQTTMGLDVSQYLAAAQQQVQAMGGQAAGIDSLINVAERFNSKGKLVGATVKALTKDFKELTVEIEKATKAQQKAGSGIINDPRAARPLAVQGGNVSNIPKPPTGPTPTDIAFSQAAAERIRTAFPAPPNSTIQQIAKYETAISKVQNLLASGKISGVRFDEIFKALQAGQGLGKLGVLSGDEQKLVSALSSITKGFKDATVAGKAFADGHVNAFRITEALLLKEAIGALVIQLQRAVTEAITFQIKISEIRTLSTENQASFQAWGKAIEGVSNALGLPQVEVATAAYNALSSQIVEGKDQTVNFIKTAGDLARVGVSDIKESGQLLASIFNSYGVSVERAEEISAKLFVAVDRGNFTVKDLAGNFGRVSTTAAAIGVSLEEVLAAMTTLTRQGVTASDSQTQLLNVFLKLQNPTGATTKFLKSLGFETGQSAVQALGFIGVLKEIEKATKGDTAALADFGGELRAIRGLIGLTTRGKGTEFAEDLRLLQEQSVDRFNAAKVIRGESEADRLTIEFTKVKNFFTNEFGQSLLKTADEVTNKFGGMAKVIKTSVEVIASAATVFVTYKVATTGASFAMAGFNAATNIFNKKEAPELQQNLTKTQKATKGVQDALTAAAKVVTFAVLLDEAIKYKRELDSINKKSEEFENVLTRIKNAREGKTETGEVSGQKLFADNALKQSDQFGKTVDNVFKPLLQKQADAAKNANQVLSDLQAKGKETATVLGVAFKTASDSISNTIKTYADNIKQADKAIIDSKKNLLGIRQTVQDLILDLQLEFATDEQKIQLRQREIQRLTDEAVKLLGSSDEDEISKGRQLGKEALQLVKANQSARLQLEVEREKQFRQQSAARGFRPDNSPIQVSTKRAQDELVGVADRIIEAEKKVQERKNAEIKQNEKLIVQEKERQRLLEIRVKEFQALTPREADQTVRQEFRDPATGKFDEQKFSKTFDDRAKRITDLVKTQEERNAIAKTFEEAKLNLLKQQSAEVNLQLIQNKQLELGQQRDSLKSRFEDATKQRIKSSETVDKAGKELDVAADVVRGFLDRARQDEKLSTIGQGENKFQEFGQRITRGIIDAVNAIPGGNQIPVSERERITRENQPQIDRILQLQNEFLSERQKLTARGPDGKPLGTEQNLRNLEALAPKIFLELENFISKFTGQVDNKNFAVPGGASLGENRQLVRDALDTFRKAFAGESGAVKTQEQLQQELNKFASPVEIAAAKQVNALDVNTAALEKSIITQQQFIDYLKSTGTPANVPTAQISPFGKHHGGLIQGPGGYDNLFVRAEKDEFIVNARSTKKWLPQLIEMNEGKNPKIAGHYHEGGLVQTNVGDINITMSGPATSEKTMLEIGKGLRRLIRMGKLSLNTNN